MTHTIDFDDLVLWGSKATFNDQRPYSKFQLHADQGTAKLDLWGLLDTGADYLVLPSNIEQSINIDLSTSNAIIIQTAAGYKKVLSRNVDITLLNKRVTVKAVFGFAPPALIGRLPILAIMDFGIDIDGWAYRKI